MKTILEFKNVSKTFGEQPELPALQNINIEVKENSLILIRGPSGSGKSTFIHLSSLLDTPFQGKVYFNDIDTSSLSKTQKSTLRRKEIGIIYQRDNLLSYLNLLENVMLPMLSKNRNRALKILENQGIQDYKHYPTQITPFDQQKTALARSLINDPSLILADEPTGELKTTDTQSYLELLIKNKNKTIIIASNNPDLDPYFDQVYQLKDGILKLVE